MRSINYIDKIIAVPEVIPGQPDKLKITYRLVDDYADLVYKEIVVSPCDNAPIEEHNNGVTYTNLISNVLITDNAGSGEYIDVMDIPGGQSPDKYRIRILRGEAPPPEESIEIEDPRP